MLPKKDEQKDERTNLQKFNFPIIALMFLVGALTFSVALAYNNFARSIILHYSLGDTIYSSFINFVITTVISLLFLWLIWRKYPTIVETKLI